MRLIIAALLLLSQGESSPCSLWRRFSPVGGEVEGYGMHDVSALGFTIARTHVRSFAAACVTQSYRYYGRDDSCLEPGAVPQNCFRTDGRATARVRRNLLERRGNGQWRVVC